MTGAGDDHKVAVIGMAIRVPGAAGAGQYWRNLTDGVESISRFSEDELRAAGVDGELLADPAYVRAKGVLAGADEFDAGFFGYARREAEFIDPQQRVFLEAAWSALEDAGYDPDRLDVTVGVYGGGRMSQYVFNLYDAATRHTELDELLFLLGNDKDYLTSRVSYQLNFTGPSIATQTACSSSLVAVASAYQSLLTHECDLALAGGVRVSLPLRAGYLYTEDGIGARDGHCRAFDAAATGTVFGDGAGVVVLKRLRDAVADGDHVEAVLCSAAVNNDGSAKPGWTAPALDGQAEVVAAALAAAELTADALGYVETHGTGTLLGDPIEVAALSRAFADDDVRPGSCPIGSVKPNIGHLSAAAGIASLVKVVLALRHRELPPSINFATANPEIDFASSPFFVNGELREFTGRDGHLRAGVSSFGMGGTNCHVILEESPR
ncbi:polyketide synthase [Amycolatopsis sp. H20-H5]|uniref:polyketide synthase n=1 Tax=Amycolatopsis sp. H20-H5 TaxID=3046309 RepID=UPI002DB5D586|nr:polyketide synthase [Amycolatopsis sp. H20-H5]MEC3979006.1 polyketide synthase [Amycolatopsis sp. H20-H5]